MSIVSIIQNKLQYPNYPFHDRIIGEQSYTLNPNKMKCIWAQKWEGHYDQIRVSWKFHYGTFWILLYQLWVDNDSTLSIGAESGSEQAGTVISEEYDK